MYSTQILSSVMLILCHMYFWTSSWMFFTSGRKRSVRHRTSEALRIFLQHSFKMSTANPSPCLAFVQRVTRAFLRTGGHDATCYPSLHIHTARPGFVLGSLRVEKRNTNRLGTLHGGVICSLTDTMGSLALASKGLYSTGVSTDIHTTFVKPSALGEEVTVEGKVVSLGETSSVPLLSLLT